MNTKGSTMKDSAMHAFSYRELYCPAHFGNSYEEMWPIEAEHIISEARWWGPGGSRAP